MSFFGGLVQLAVSAVALPAAVVIDATSCATGKQKDCNCTKSVLGHAADSSVDVLDSVFGTSGYNIKR